MVLVVAGVVGIVVVVVGSVTGMLKLCSHWFKAQFGNWHSCRAVLI